MICKLAHQNEKEIMAFGFLPEKTFIFSNYETFDNNFYRVVVEMMKRTTGNQIRGTYGLNLDNSIGQLSWPCFQMACRESIFQNKSLINEICNTIFTVCKQFNENPEFAATTIQSFYDLELQDIKTWLQSIHWTEQKRLIDFNRYEF